MKYNIMILKQLGWIYVLVQGSPAIPEFSICQPTEIYTEDIPLPPAHPFGIEYRFRFHGRIDPPFMTCYSCHVGRDFEPDVWFQDQIVEVFAKHNEEYRGY